MLSARRSLETRCHLTTSCPGSLAIGLYASLGALRARSGLRITSLSPAPRGEVSPCPTLGSGSADGGDRWLLRAARGHLGGTVSTS